MKKLSFEKFTQNAIATKSSSLIKGGVDGTETRGGTSFFGYGSSTCDWNPNNGQSCTYYFEDGRMLRGDCIE